MVVVVEALVVVFPEILVRVDVVLVDVVLHVGVCEDVLELGVVVVRDLSERVENIWVNWAALDHTVPLGFLGSIGARLPPGCDNELVKSECRRVEGQVGGVAHAAERTH